MSPPPPPHINPPHQIGGNSLSRPELKRSGGKKCEIAEVTRSMHTVSEGYWRPGMPSMSRWHSFLLSILHYLVQFETVELSLGISSSCRCWWWWHVKLTGCRLDSESWITCQPTKYSLNAFTYITSPVYQLSSLWIFEEIDRS